MRSEVENKLFSVATTYFPSRKRTILECVSLNRTVSDVSLVLTKRKPFDFFAERPLFETTRGDCPNLEPDVAVQPYVTTFLHPPEPHILRIDNMMRMSA